MLYFETAVGRDRLRCFTGSAPRHGTLARGGAYGAKAVLGGCADRVVGGNRFGAGRPDGPAGFPQGHGRRRSEDHSVFGSRLVFADWPDLWLVGRLAEV